MYISLNWIKDYVNLDGVDIKALINQFTLSCAEVEGVEEKGKDISGVITAKIIKVENHPTSKKLHLLKVDTGKTVLDIVCGAPNVREGMIVPLATVGANVKGLKIESAIVGGFPSNGMCCSAKELGFSDDNSGLFEFPENSEIGIDIKEILDIEDIVFEVDNKSLTNRPDMWGHYGIAREIAALTKRELKEIVVLEEQNSLPKLPVSINTKKCFRYSSATMSNISRQKSPINMQIRLYYCGMREINFLTDITNYIMLELGQPMHAFDHNIVKDITVKDLVSDTKFITLDKGERILPSGTMVIASGEQPVAIAGVMGGCNSEIKEDTSSVFIESACFDGTEVRKTATTLGLRTESSSRYEKMLDPELTIIALKRFIHLVKMHDKDSTITSRITDVYNYKYPEVTIKITKDFIDGYVGMNIPEKTILEILNNLEFKVLKEGAGRYVVSPPSFRTTKDIRGKVDLVEEITRIYGYDNITPQTTSQPVQPVTQDKVIDLEYNIKNILATRYNLNEIHSYIWYDSEMNKQLNINPKCNIKIVNAIQKENNQIRSTIIPTMLKVVVENKNDYSNFGFFEIGRIVEGIDKEGLVEESKSLGICLYSKGEEGNLLIKLKEILDYLFQNEIKNDISFVPTNPITEIMSPANHYNIYYKNENLGEIGVIHPLVKKQIDGKCSIAVCEINFSKVCEIEEKESKFEKVSKYPQCDLDFNFIIPKTMLYSDIIKIAGNINTTLSYKVSLSDIYDMEEEENKSYTLHYRIWSDTHTLSGEEIETFHKGVIEHFKGNGINLKS